MKKFEYKTKTYWREDYFADFLNEEGEEGWEYVNTIDEGDYDTIGFKREK